MVWFAGLQTESRGQAAICPYPILRANTDVIQEKAGRQRQQERVARLGGGSTILLFVGGLSSSTSDTASDAFMLAVEMLRGGNERVQVGPTTRRQARKSG